MRLSLVPLLALVSLGAACAPWPDPYSEEGKDTSARDGGLTQLAVTIELPVGASLLADQLTVSSLQTSDAPAKQGRATVEVLGGDSAEAVFAASPSGNLVLLALTNPSETRMVALNADSTARALVMLHPWATDLSPLAKRQAMDAIALMPQFPGLRDAVAASIARGELDPLASGDVLAALGTLREGVTTKQVDLRGEPLSLSADSQVVVTNRDSSASYGLGVYDSENNLVTSARLDGVAKSQQLFDTFLRAAFDFEPDSASTSLDVRGGGDFKVRAKSGLVLDSSTENRIGRLANGWHLVADAIGLFSTQVKRQISNEECRAALGLMAWNAGTSLWDAFAKGELTPAQLALDFTGVFSQIALEAAETIETCAEPVLEGKPLVRLAPLRKLLKLVDVVGKLKTAFDGSAFLADWAQFPASVEFCVARGTDGRYWPCRRIEISNLRVTRVGPYGEEDFLGCPYILYSFTFDYEDPQRLVQPDLSNLRVYRDGPGGATYGKQPWLNPGEYHYPASIGPTTITFGLIEYISEWTTENGEYVLHTPGRITAYFTDPEDPERVISPYSNQAVLPWECETE